LAPVTGRDGAQTFSLTNLELHSRRLHESQKVPFPRRIRRDSTAAAAQAVGRRLPALPEVRWRCCIELSEEPGHHLRSGETIASASAITGGKFQIRVFGAGEIVPPSHGRRVQQGPLNALTRRAITRRKNKTFAFDTTLPFGMKPETAERLDLLRRRP